MTDIASMEIEGLDRLVARLDKLGKLPGELPKAGKEGMELYVESPAKQNCPVDEGRLRGGIVTIDETNSVKTGTNIKHGPYVEFGTGLYAENGQGRKTPWVYFYSGRKGLGGFRLTRGQRAQPFLRPAWDNGKRNVVRHIRDRLTRAAQA